MNQNFTKLAAVALFTTSIFTTVSFAEEAKAEEPAFKLTGNVQAQAIKAVYDNDADNTLDNSFLRANVGGKYASDNFEAKYKLYELEEKLPSYFLRISKSTILNTRKLYSITKNLAGASKIEFQGTYKTVYCSRNYYKALKEKLTP